LGPPHLFTLFLIAGHKIIAFGQPSLIQVDGFPLQVIEAAEKIVLPGFKISSPLPIYLISRKIIAFT